MRKYYIYLIVIMTLLFVLFILYFPSHQDCSNITDSEINDIVKERVEDIRRGSNVVEYTYDYDIIKINRHADPMDKSTNVEIRFGENKYVRLTIFNDCDSNWYT